MKNIITWVVIMSVVIGVGLYTYNDTEEVLIEKETVTVEVLPEWAENEEAVQAAKDVIRKQELEQKERELVDQIVGLQTELDTVRGELESL